MSNFFNPQTTWTFLGRDQIGVAAPRTAVVTWTGQFQQIWIEYFVLGNAANNLTRVLVGPTAGPNESGTAACCSIIEGTTLTTTSVSVSGWVVNGALNTNRRYGNMWVNNQQTLAKQMRGSGMHSANPPVATTVPVFMQMSGNFIDTTNLINSAKLVSYTALTGNTIGSNMNIGTYINVWGRNNE